MSLTAAALVIGNEILTGKIREANVSVLGEFLFQLGVELRRVVFCPDEVEVIAADLNALRASHDYVFTSGGVGPTHDDVTLPAVAQAFARPLTRAKLIEDLIRGYHRERVTADHLRMADVPEGAELLATSDMPWPTVVVDNVYVMPGVPEIFRMKLSSMRDRFGDGSSFSSRAVYTMCDEGHVASTLTALAARHPGLLVGSYPRFRGEDYRVKVTVDGRDRSEIDRAIDELVAELPADLVVRVE